MHPLVRIVALVVSLVPLVALADDAAKPTKKKADTEKKRGMASFYAKSLAGRKTASGEPYDPNAMTAAHRTLPMGTKLKVTNPKTDKSVVVTVNDRGPVPKERSVDLSSGAAKEIGITKAGVAPVETEVVSKP